LKELDPSLKISDVNNDNIIDLNDAIYIVTYFAEKFDTTESFGNLTAFFEDYDVVFNQTGTRRLNEFPDGGEILDRGIHDDTLTGSSGYPEFMETGSDKRNLQWSDTCGADSSGNFRKGKGTKPKLTWDEANCIYDSTLWDKLSKYQKVQAQVSWLKWGGAPLYANFFLDQPDGARAYKHYRSGTGKDLNVDYQKGINEDAIIKYYNYNKAIADVKNAALIMFADEASFSFYSKTAYSVPNGESVNWQRTIGGHSIWLEGTVKYNKGACTLDMTITLFVEDYYNFNPGQADLSTGIPDNVNCLFERLGWAKGFFSRGKLQIKESVSLSCCQDTDCGDATQYDCKCGKCLAPCPTRSFSGGQGFRTYAINLNKTYGTFTFYYEMHDIPGQTDIYYEGSLIYTTGGLVSGSQSVPITFGSTKSKDTAITVKVMAPNNGTAWMFSVSCPPV
jgi:hypothetical protein